MNVCILAEEPLQPQVFFCLFVETSFDHLHSASICHSSPHLSSSVRLDGGRFTFSGFSRNIYNIADATLLLKYFRHHGRITVILSSPCVFFLKLMMVVIQIKNIVLVEVVVFYQNIQSQP